MKKKEKLAIIHQHYPNAVTTIDGVNWLIDFVEKVLDLEPAQVMLADSICSDDVNSIQYPARAGPHIGIPKTVPLGKFIGWANKPVPAVVEQQKERWLN